MDYNKLSDFEINCRVAVALGMKAYFFMNAEAGDNFDECVPSTERGPIWQTSKYEVGDYNASNGNCFNPCNKPSDAWPILLQKGIAVAPPVRNERGWVSWCSVNEYTVFKTRDANPLRAAMIVFLMMQGDE